MKNEMITEALRARNEKECYVAMETYSEGRAMNFAVAYLKDLIERGELKIKDFKLGRTSMSFKPTRSKLNKIWEVHYVVVNT